MSSGRDLPLCKVDACKKEDSYGMTAVNTISIILKNWNTDETKNNTYIFDRCPFFNL